MIIEWPESVIARAQLHAALGEPARLAIVDRLLLGDASPSELGREIGLPSNLLAHHIKLLDQAGLVGRTRSEGDLRRTYLRLLPSAHSVVNPAEVRDAARVVFVCTHNAARSQLASALWKRESAVPTTSAGVSPAKHIHPLTLWAARQNGLTLTRGYPMHVNDVLRPDDLVVVVCDSAHESLDDNWERLHWSIADPSRAGTKASFEHAFQDISGRVDRLAPIIRRKR